MFTLSKKKIALVLSAAVLTSSAMATIYAQTSYISNTSYDRTSKNMQEGSVKFKIRAGTATMVGTADINAYAGSSGNYAKPFTVCYNLWLRNASTGKDVTQPTSSCFNSRLVNGKHVIDAVMTNRYFPPAFSGDEYRFILSATSGSFATSIETRKYGTIEVVGYV